MERQIFVVVMVALALFLAEEQTTRNTAEEPVRLAQAVGQDITVEGLLDQLDNQMESERKTSDNLNVSETEAAKEEISDLLYQAELCIGDNTGYVERIRKIADDFGVDLVVEFGVDKKKLEDLLQEGYEAEVYEILDTIRDQPGHFRNTGLIKRLRVFVGKSGQELDYFETSEQELQRLLPPKPTLPQEVSRLAVDDGPEWWLNLEE